MQGKITYFDNFSINEYSKTNVEIEHFIKGWSMFVRFNRKSNL